MLNRKVDWLFGKSWFRKRTHRLPVRKHLTRPLKIECLEDRTLLAHLLGAAESFALLGGSAVTNTGSTAIVGDIGVSPGTDITGFPPGVVTGGTIHANDTVASQAQSDLTTAYNLIAGRTVTTDLTGQDLGGLTLTAGVYHFSSSAQLTGTLTLDAQGNPNAEFDFQIGSALTTASNSSVRVINGGDPDNVYWQVGSSATLGTTTAFAGNILALTSITLQTGASVDGRALARNGAGTMDTNRVSIVSCGTCSVGANISGSVFYDANHDNLFGGDTGLGASQLLLISAGVLGCLD